MTSHALAPRLAPINRPRSLLVRLVGWLVERRLGQPMSPVRVIFARFPEMVRPHVSMMRLAERLPGVDPVLGHLVSLHVSRLNGCDFCGDLHRALALRDRCPGDKLAALDDVEGSPALTEAERAALLYVGEVTRRRHVTDATFERLRASFDERRVVQLTWLSAVVSYTNLMAAPLGLVSDGFCELDAARLRAASSR